MTIAFNLLVILACFSISMPTAWMSIISFLILIFWVISGNYAYKIKSIANNPAALMALLLLLLYIIGILYSSSPWDLRETFFLKYAKLLLIPILVSSIHSEKVRGYAVHAFLLGALVMLAISYLKWLQILPFDLGWADIASEGQGFTAFKNRIAHNILMAFAMYAMLHKAYFVKTSTRWLWLILAILALFNIWVVVNGRTGQLISIALLALFFIQHWRLKACVSLMGIFMALFLFKEPIQQLMPERLSSMTQEIKDHHSNENLTSAGIRLEMYKNTFELIKTSPWIGFGTGAFKTEYNQFVASQDTLLKGVTNPHNQYLLTLLELGLIGLLTLLYFFYQSSQLLINARSDQNIFNAYLMQGLVATIALGSLLNSLLLDATEGKFFCIMAGLLLSSYVKKPALKRIKFHI